MGLSPINAILVAGGVIAGINAHLQGPGLEGLKQIQTSSKSQGKGSQKPKEVINGGSLGALGEGEAWYYNPNPKVWLLGHHNEVKTKVNGGLEMTLVDSGAQISTISDALHAKLDLSVWQLPDEVNIVGLQKLYSNNCIIIYYLRILYIILPLS